MTTNRKILTGGALLVAIILFFAVNILSGAGLRHARLDLTENKLYTLSQGSRNVLRDLKEPISLKLFYSEKLAADVPQIKVYGNRVRELLEEYAALSGGKVRLEVIDPEPFSDAEDAAVRAGIQAVPLDRAGRSFYFGLSGTNSVDEQETIAFFQMDKEQFLEYDLTKLVYALSSPKKPVVGVLGALPLEFGPGGMMAAMRGQSQPYAIMTQLRQFFEVKSLEPNLDRIEDNISILLLAHPKDLSKAALYAIDQFVMRGGRVIAFMDPHAETQAQQPNAMGMMMPPMGDNSSIQPDLLKSWGVTIEDGKFVADLALAQRVQTGQTGGRQIVDYLAWLNTTNDQMDKGDVVTADINTVNLASVGAIRRIDGATTNVQPLILSSDKAMLQETAKIVFRPDPGALLEAFKPSGERFLLAARITGPVKSAFGDQAPAAEKTEADAAKGGDKKEAAKPLPAHLKESAKPVNIILVADADLLDDRFWVRTQEMLGQRVMVPIASNADFVVNAIDNLGGSNDLIGLRSRGRSQRPFEVIEALRRDAEQQYQAREKALQQKLEATEKQLQEIQGKNKGGSKEILSQEEQSALEGFRAELVSTRQELRGVQRELNRDIERMQSWVRFVNIGLMPILVGIAALALALAARAKRRQRVTAS